MVANVGRAMTPRIMVAVVFATAIFSMAWGQGPLREGSKTPSPQYSRSGNSQDSLQDGGIVNSSLVLSDPTALARASLQRTVTSVFVISVSGADSSQYGYGGCGLLFTRGTMRPTKVTGEVLNVASGINWQPQYGNSPVKACEFGAIGDGKFNQKTGFVAGTDNTAAIQNALDHAMQKGLQTVCLNDGQYKTSDTLQMGWGQSFYTLALVACNGGRNAYANSTAGVIILPTKTDRCAVNMQGGRTNAIRAILFLGRNLPYGLTVYDGHQPWPVTEDRWLDPALVPAENRPGGLQTHSPYAAICIDAYSGKQPVVPYPTVSYPGWTGIASQYNKYYTSNIELTNIGVAGFAVGINLQPNSDGNGDFLKIDKFDCQQTVYCASVAQHDSRSVQFTNVSCNGVFTVLTNVRFGAGVGKLGGPIDNITCGLSYQLFDIGALNHNGNISISNIYAEGVVRIGQFRTGGSSNASIKIDGCDWSSYDHITGVIPAALIEAMGTQTPITIQNCHLIDSRRISTLVRGSQNIVINGGMLRGGTALGALFNLPSIQNALNYTGGILVGDAAVFPSGRSSDARLQWLNASLGAYMPAPSSDASEQQILGTDANFGINGFRSHLTQATTGFVDAVNARRWTFALGPTGADVALSNTDTVHVRTPATYTGCDTMIFTYADTQQRNSTTAISGGDLMYHYPTGTLFVVTSLNNADASGNIGVTTRQMNNMQVDKATGACARNTNSDPALKGHTKLIHTNATIPRRVYFGTFTAGSTVVTDVVDGETSGAYIGKYLSPGDAIWTYPRTDSYFKWPYAMSGRLAAVTPGAPASIGLSLPATQSGRFPLLPFPIVGGPQ